MVGARQYHETSNIAPGELGEATDGPDPELEPRPYKVYPDRPRVDLPGIRAPQLPALATVAESAPDPLARSDQPRPGRATLETLATVCYAGVGVTSEVDQADADTPVRYRAASCTGNLHHVDLYLVCEELPELAAGVYHFDPVGYGLNRLRSGDHRGVLAAATGDEEGVAAAPATLVATTTWWRNAWYYGDRAYRHAFWDAGTVLANVLATAHALDHRAEVVAGFADGAVADLLGLNPEETAPLALVPLGAGSPVPAPTAPDAIDPETVPCAPERGDVSLLTSAWRDSALADGAAAAVWRDRLPGTAGTRPAGDGRRLALDPVDPETATARPLWNTIQRRRSCREFTEEPLTRRALGTILDRATRGVPSAWSDGCTPGLAFNDVYVLTMNVTEVPRGVHRFHPEEAALERVGDTSRADAVRIAMGQEWAGDAATNVYCVTDVDAVVEAAGDRGYRLAQLEAGVTLGRLYLATYAHRRLGGTGLTFFDEAVAAHLGTDADGQLPTTMFALGMAGDRHS